jgi:hypothetical protein
MSQADDFHSFATDRSPPRKNWSLSVEAAKPGAAPVKPVMYTPGPVDVRAYEADHAKPSEGVVEGRS